MDCSYARSHRTRCQLGCKHSVKLWVGETHSTKDNVVPRTKQSDQQLFKISDCCRSLDNIHFETLQDWFCHFPPYKSVNWKSYYQSQSLQNLWFLVICQYYYFIGTWNIKIGNKIHFYCYHKLQMQSVSHSKELMLSKFAYLINELHSCFKSSNSLCITQLYCYAIMTI